MPKKKLWEIKNPHRLIKKLESIEDDQLLEDVVKYSKIHIVRLKALEKIKDQQVLKQLRYSLGNSDDSMVLRHMVATKLEEHLAVEREYAYLAIDLKENPRPEIENLVINAFDKISDFPLMQLVAAKAENKKIFAKALNSVVDQNDLFEAAMICRNNNLTELLIRIDEKELQQKLITEASWYKARETACEIYGGHQWNECTCKRCGKVNHKGHIWDGCTCTICNYVRDEGHDPVTREVVDYGDPYNYDYNNENLIFPMTYEETCCRKCGRGL